MPGLIVGVRSCLVNVKASTRKTRDGQTIRYLPLADNEWDPVAKGSKTRVLYSFGREDRLDVARVRRLGSARREVDVERVLFALVANRALKPSSKPAASG